MERARWFRLTEGDLDLDSTPDRCAWGDFGAIDAGPVWSWGGSEFSLSICIRIEVITTRCLEHTFATLLVCYYLPKPGLAGKRAA